MFEISKIRTIKTSNNFESETLRQRLRVKCILILFRVVKYSRRIFEGLGDFFILFSRIVLLNVMFNLLAVQ